jgi:hypothetical protein
MTPAAIEALAKAGFSRRDFLKTSGALVVGFSAAAISEQAGFAQGPFDTRASHVDPKQLDSWIAIAADGKVTAYTGKCFWAGHADGADAARRRGAVGAGRS